ncbi:uncharacterized protein [Nicotiana sylvestris]|uniref:uncharacterized protein n=1 Tax=Nicotiana sylvestris TaxID=4096 RepID=UPI00388C3E89
MDIPKTVMLKAKVLLPRPLPSYPQRLAKQKNENQFKKFIEMIKILSINMPLVEDLEQMPGYAKFMKDLVTKKRSMDCETIKMTHQVRAIVQSMASKLEDPGTFTIPCTIGSVDFAKALCDLGESINLMPYSIFKTLGIGQPRATSMRLQMADRTMKRPLATGKALVDVKVGERTFWVGDEKVVFHVYKSMRQPNSNEMFSFVDLVTEVIVDDTSAMINVDDPLEAVLLNHDVTEDEGLKNSTNKSLNRGTSRIGVESFASTPQVDATLEVLQRKKKAIGWTLVDIRGISPSFACTRLYLRMMPNPPWKIKGGYNQILIAPEDQEKATFTYLYGTFSFIQMPFGLCNAPATFQWCMMAVFTNMVEDLLEVFMDDFSVERGAFLGMRHSTEGLSKTSPRWCMKAFELLKYRLTTTPIITAPNWSLPFELMCDASDVAVGAVLGQKVNKMFHLVYYASKTMNDA